MRSLLHASVVWLASSALSVFAHYGLWWANVAAIFLHPLAAGGDREKKSVSEGTSLPASFSGFFNNLSLVFQASSHCTRA